MNYTLGFLLIALALLLLVSVANNSWASLWDAFKKKESADTNAPQQTTPGQPF